MQQHARKSLPGLDPPRRGPEVGRDGRARRRGGCGDARLSGEPGCITFHSWLSRADRLDRPDRMVVDLDPSVDRPAEIRGAAAAFVATAAGTRAPDRGRWPPARAAITSSSRWPGASTTTSVREFSRDLAELAVRAPERRVHDRAAQGQARRQDPDRHDAQRLRAHRGRALLGPSRARGAGRDPAPPRGASEATHAPRAVDDADRARARPAGRRSVEGLPRRPDAHRRPAALDDALAEV